MNQFNILTIYPDFFESFNKHGLIKKGLDKDIIHINTIDLRLHTQDKHNRVDFKTYGGGPGMLMMVQPLRDAIHTAKKSSPGKTKVQCSDAMQFAKEIHHFLISGMERV